MLDSSMLGNDNNEIDVSLPAPKPPQELPRSASSLLGNDNNQIDVAIPKPTRASIAAERARRREAAAKKRTERRQNAEAAEEDTSAALRELQQKAVAAAEPVPAPEEPDLLQRVHDAEVAHFYEKQRIARRDAALKEAARSYQTATAAARSTCKKLRRQSDRAWKREAAEFHAKTVLPRTERILGGVNIAVCMTLAASIAVGMLVLERPTVSEIENRNLATMPDFSWESYWNGEYTAGITNYYDDTVPMRSVFKNMTASFRKHMGWNDEDAAVFHGIAPTAQQTEPVVTTAATTTTPDPAATVTTTLATGTTTAATTAATAAPPPAEDEGGELSNNILIYKKRAISLYGGSFSVGENYASYVNAFKKDLGAKVNVYSMVIPTPCSFYTPDEYKHMIGSEEKNIQHINENLVDVKPVNVLGALAPHAAENIYMRTDHHWSSLGAFYAAEEFAAVARVPFARLSEYDRVAREGYVGTMYGYSGDITLKNNPEEFFFYEPHAAYTTTYFDTKAQNAHEGRLLMDIDRLGDPINWYLVYLGGDEKITHVQTEVKNGRTLAVFKDSYGNALIPWFTSSFENIYVIDIRYFKKNAVKYLQQVGATDVLFAMNTFSATGGNSKKIDRIRRQ